MGARTRALSEGGLTDRSRAISDLDATHARAVQVSLKHCPAGADGELPSASTCFHVLKLPPYSHAETLAERLTYAIGNSKGLIDMS